MPVHTPAISAASLCCTRSASLRAFMLGRLILCDPEFTNAANVPRRRCRGHMVLSRTFCVRFGCVVQSVLCRCLKNVWSCNSANGGTG
ncbi:hypothetical protein K438DRAFT_972068 [Mycena galopus ATCC 62051]|nr:hypothetical protein K438DRAFT_972068 [Mycena galopus ATCC 62051]